MDFFHQTRIDFSKHQTKYAGELSLGYVIGHDWDFAEQNYDKRAQIRNRGHVGRWLAWGRQWRAEYGPVTGGVK